MGNASRYVPRRGFSAAQPGVAGIPATPGYRPTRRAGGRAHRSIDTHGPSETATDGALHRGNFTAPHGLSVAQNTSANSIATISRCFGFGLGDVGWCRWAGALDRGTRMVPSVPRVAGVPATLGCAEEHPLRGTGRCFATRRVGSLDGLDPVRVPLPHRQRTGVGSLWRQLSCQLERLGRQRLPTPWRQRIALSSFIVSSTARSHRTAFALGVLRFYKIPTCNR